MKSERRHELQHNDLAEWILKCYEQVVPYKNALLGTGLLLIVLLIGVSLWRSHSLAQAGEAWNSLGYPIGIPVFTPNFPDEKTISVMERASQTYPGTAAAQWAQVFAGDTALMVGTNKVLTEKKVGIDYLNQARELYDKALKEITIPAAREQAMFGRARALESLIEKKAQLDEAIAAYKELNDRFPRGMFKPIADQRLEQLEKQGTLKFYEALAQYTPKPKAESPSSQLGKIGALPDEPLVPQTPVRSNSGSQGPAVEIPAPSLTPTTPAKPEAAKLDSTMPGVDSAKPPVAKPDTSKAESPKPDASKPAAAKPEAAKPEAAKPEAVKPDAPKPEAPKKDK
jgi:hypothetical protein